MTLPTAKRARPTRSRNMTEGGTWQAEKSLLTQTQIVEATMQCLIEIGYAQTTTDKIAQKAGVSRGAMTHHFKSRDAVFIAAAKYITELRAVEYGEAIGKVKVPAGTLPSYEDMRDTIVSLQKYYARPSFIALHELQRGARADKTLKAAMAPLEKVLDDKISAHILQHFPFWTQVQGAAEVLRDLIFSSLQGIAIDPVGYVKGARLQRLVDLLARVTQTEFDKDYAAAHGAQALERGQLARRRAS
ncbi:TetR/AcrR family transcriptional regulator [Aquabacterium sp.]|uniref:TetR/AcrR family transcriptional regulator n=1 Tax=Aquabacterium sp. TaxID=1872578 RepID=UPI002CE7379E|nr:TetR/AcrR family transcriptional regulator [Aquabacterium sp.]HSW05246.1 TetR/AcrR family transcriptional regulator [Aquabacterium sp.]